jgi:hypothetical protein
MTHSPGTRPVRQPMQAGRRYKQGDQPTAVASKCAKCLTNRAGVKKNPALSVRSAVFIERMNLYKSGARSTR